LNAGELCLNVIRQSQYCPCSVLQQFAFCVCHGEITSLPVKPRSVTKFNSVFASVQLEADIEAARQNFSLSGQKYPPRARGARPRILAITLSCRARCLVFRLALISAPAMMLDRQSTISLRSHRAIGGLVMATKVGTEGGGWTTIAANCCQRKTITPTRKISGEQL
jgi:hypothetical protein